MRFFRLRPVRVDLGDVVVQIVAVALGVVLGFAANAWNEHRHLQSLERETVANIVDELRSNQDGMHVVIANHARVAASYEALVKGAYATHTISRADASAVLRRAGPFGVNVPLAIAWQIAQNDQGLTLLPYRVRYQLGWIYQLQSIYYQREEFYQNSLETFSEPSGGNFFFEMENLANQLESVVGTERQLDGLYTAALRQEEAEEGRG